MQRGVAYKKLNQQVSIKTHSAWTKIDKTKEWTDYLSNKRQKFDGILMIYACGFGLRPLWRLFCTDCCPLGARWLSIVRSREVSATRRFQMYYFYRKSNREHGICQASGKHGKRERERERKRKRKFGKDRQI